MHIPKERCDFAYCVLRRKSAHSSENLAAKKRTFRRNGVILLLACCGDKVQFPDAKTCTFIGKFGGEKAHIPRERCDFASCMLRSESAVPGCEKVHIPKARCDFAYCVWQRKSAHSSETLAAKKRTFRRKGVILLLASCGEKVQFPDVKKCTFRRKGVILPTACCGEKMHIHRKIRRRKSAHSEGMV